LKPTANFFIKLMSFNYISKYQMLLLEYEVKQDPS
jgi:hypothetical protein